MKSNQNEANANAILRDIKMDTQTRFHINGDIDIFPCGWVDEQVTGGGSRRSKGSMYTEEDGTSFFRAYRQGGKSIYERLYVTSNGEVKRTRKKIIVKLVLPLEIGKPSVIELLMRQTQLILNYFRLNNDRSLWT